ncbi:MAG: acyl-CoA dehydrogenase family protein [Pseudomonadales bacterium]
MDIGFSDQHEAFRQEVRAFLQEHLTDELREAQRFCPGIFLDKEHNLVWHKILHAKGWIAPAWPKAYGGTGWDLTERYIWSTETTLAGAPSLAPMGLGMCGPMLIGFGTQAQKDYYLPRILSAEDYWCQGYSEPGSGSDLASLALKARVDGDQLVLSGTKIWTTHAHVANRMFALVRTDDSGKPQQGITFLLLDMDSPGITVEPILFASGTHEVNQVFFDEVRVPLSNVVGELNQGWTVAKYLLEFERGGGGSAAHQTGLARIRNLAAQASTGSGTPLAEDPDFKRKLDATDVQLQAIQYSEFRIMAALSGGQNPGPESSMMKNLSANMGQRLTELAVETIEHGALVHQPEARTVGSNVPVIGPEGGTTAFARYFNMRASSIAGGTNEVQKNIIAKLVLGL